MARHVGVSPMTVSRVINAKRTCARKRAPRCWPRSRR
ncbi:MAG: LacI family DNA-binding transcriptional regulator [Asticcacaulis sp.]